MIVDEVWDQIMALKTNRPGSYSETPRFAVDNDHYEERAHHEYNPSREEGLSGDEKSSGLVKDFCELRIDANYSVQ